MLDSDAKSPPNWTARQIYVLGSLVVLNIFSQLDRGLLGILQEPIKHEFKLTDGQLGLLGGTAFAILYSAAGIPLARLAERLNRVTIISASFGFWSLMTALCGHAGTVWHLAAARIGVSLGEAGCAPPSHSLISDYFPAARRATALSIYAVGGPMGAMIAAVAGGWLAQNYGWRSAFYAAGFGGLMIAILMRLTIREPARTGVKAARTDRLADAARYLIAKPAWVHIVLGGTLGSFASYSVVQSLTSFMIRTHHMELSAAAKVTGLALGGMGAIGTFIVGVTAERLSRRNPRALTIVPALGMAWSAVCFATAFQVASPVLCIILLFGAAMTSNAFVGPMFAVAQGVAPANMRATSSALLYFVMNVIGYGLGPFLTGHLSDVMADRFMAAGNLTRESCKLDPTALCQSAVANGLQTALTIASLIYLLSGLHFFLARRTLSKDMLG